MPNLSEGKAKIIISHRRLPKIRSLPARTAVTLGLLIVTMLSGLHFLKNQRTAGALDFTTHLVSVQTGAVGTLGLAASDLDDDGDIDVVSAGKDGIKVYEQTSAKVFTQKIIDDKDGVRVQIVDLNKDGASDLLVSLTGEQPSIRWYQNNGNLEFSGTAIGSGTDGVTYAGDIDADGDPDIITATTQSGFVVLDRWMNNGSGTFTNTQLSADSGVQSIYVADLNGNGYPDIVTGGKTGIERWGTSNGYTYSQIDIDDANTGQKHIVAKDVNQDGKTDIVAAEPAGNMVTYYRNTDGSTWQRIDLASSVDATTVQIIDLDEDGNEDVVASAQDNNAIYWFENNGADEFTKVTIVDNLQSIFGVLVTDIDNDNDFDIVGSDHMRGTVYWYERTRSKPLATTPDNITQSTDGKGTITFKSTFSDGDKDETRARIQYSVDGTNWYKPWLTKVTASSGSISLKNSEGYQVGTANGIDTDDNDEVTVTFTWDTTSSQNTGGPISGDVNGVYLRIIPRDSVGNGEEALSSSFRVDNEGPALNNFKVIATTNEAASLTWDRPSDSNDFELKIFYGTDYAKVLNEQSEVWDTTDDPNMADIEITSTAITDLTAGSNYTFKIHGIDSLGNKSSLSSISGKTLLAAVPPIPPPASITPSPTPTTNITPLLTPTPAAVATTSPTPSTPPTANPSPSPTPSPIVTSKPSSNTPPQANAGSDQVVNPDSLVILDGTNSKDPEGAPLAFSWKQIFGPAVELLFPDTATPSFNVPEADKSYVFALTIRDSDGLVDTDSTTVVARPIPIEPSVTPSKDPTKIKIKEIPSVVTRILDPVNLIILIISAVVVLVSLYNKFSHSIQRHFQSFLLNRRQKKQNKRGLHAFRTVNWQTGRSVVNAKFIIKTADAKIIAKGRSDSKGQFKLSLPVGKYTIEVKVKGLTMSQPAKDIPIGQTDIMYSGGLLDIQVQDQPLTIVIPMKQVREDMSPWETKLYNFWQYVQHKSHILAWPVFISGSGLNTVLLLWVLQSKYMIIEIVYIALVATRVWVDLRIKPSYGLVRDAISHVPLDLAVVRLYREGSNQLIMTRATDSQGKFFALPPPGVYTISVSKSGYATFTKHSVIIKDVNDADVQIQTDLMPIVPNAAPITSPA